MKNKTTTRSLLITTAAGTITGGLVGMFASPIAYWMLGRKFSGSNRWLAWAAIGLIGSPLSLVFSGAMIPPVPHPIAQSTPSKPAAVVPTPKPKPIALNVPRERLQSQFEKLGFTFEDSTTLEGQPCVKGRLDGGLATLELMGAPDNLTQVSLIAEMVNGDDQSNSSNVEYLLLTLKSIAPGWESAAWVKNTITEVAKGDRDEVVTTHGSLKFKLSMLRKFGLLTLSVEPKK